MTYMYIMRFNFSNVFVLQIIQNYYIYLQN